MRWIFCLVLSVLVVLAAAADNAFNIPSGGYKFSAGQTTMLSWHPTTSGTVTLKLHKGDNITPDSGIVLAASIPNSGSFPFTPSSSLGQGSDYTLEIIDDSDPNNINFTPKFSIAGTTGAASSLTASATKSSTSSSESSTSTGSQSSSSSSSTTSESTSSTTTKASSTSSSSTSSSTSASQGTAAPNPNAAMSLKLPGGMLAAVLGVMAFL